jgi:hypothetical protein
LEVHLENTAKENKKKHQCTENNPLKYKLPQQLFTKSSENSLIKSLYNTCDELPNLSRLDVFRTDGQNSFKFYSYPQFFVEQWTELMQKEDENVRKKKKKNTKQDVMVNI